VTDARFPERWLNDRRVRLFVISLTWSVSNRTDGDLYDDDLLLIRRVDLAAASRLTRVTQVSCRIDL
jgi:hypothetical protein